MTWSPELPVHVDAPRDELVEWLERQFRSISDWTISVKSASDEARGGLLNATSQGMPDIGVGRWGIIPWAAGMLANPVNITQDPANNQFRWQLPGVYLFTFWGLLNHDFFTSGRRVYIRFYNATKAQQLGVNLYLTPLHANQNESTFSFASYLEVQNSIINDAIQIELGGLSPISNITWTHSGFNLLRAGDL